MGNLPTQASVSMNNFYRGPVGQAAPIKQQSRAMNDDRKKPVIEREAGPKTKPCLVCRTPFPSEWAGERVCHRCKSTAAWRSGVIRPR